MAKKLQIFVSSTYKDLIAERQAAVEAILTAGHIPAGMELFSAGDESQLETIYRWIDESDIFMLLLGGRYGSIEKTSGKSYTQLSTSMLSTVRGANPTLHWTLTGENAGKTWGARGAGGSRGARPARNRQTPAVHHSRMGRHAAQPAAGADGPGGLAPLGSPARGTPANRWAEQSHRLRATAC